MNLLPRSAIGLLTVATLTGLAQAQVLVVPDNTNLSGASSSTSAWRSTTGRFQVAYDSSHFTNAGVTGPITITRLRFRASEGQPNPGGQVYTGVTVEVGNCAVDYATLSTTFATNRGTMGTLGTTNVVVQAASGALPNDNVVDIDLVPIGATFTYDPSTATDLLIDVSFPAPVPSTALVPFSCGSATVATARARMMTTATVGSLTGSSAAPPICTIDFAGTGGDPAPNGARYERFGHGCAYGSFRSYYQDWRTAEPFDLANTSIMMVPDNIAAPTGYTVLLGSTPPDLTKLDLTADSATSNALVTHPLGFTFNYVSGSTTSIKAYTKGYVWLDPAMTLLDQSVAVNDLLSRGGVSYTARLAPCWSLWDPSRNVTSHPNSGLHVITDTTGGPGNAVCYVTWYKVGRSDVSNPGTSVSDFQAVFHEATGIMEMRFGSMSVAPAGSVTVTGWSPGKVAGVESTHPGPNDLSHELLLFPLVLGPDVPAVHNASHDTLNQARPIMGTTITPQAFNLPAGMLMNMMIIDVAPLQPGLPVPGILAPGCVLSVSPSFWVYDSLALPPAASWNALPLLISPSWATMGLQFYSQVASLDMTISNVLMTNALKYTVGLN